MKHFTPITAEATAHRRADLVETVNRVLCSSDIDAPVVLATALRPHLDADLQEALDAIMGIYDARNTNLDECVSHAGALAGIAEKLLWEAEEAL